MYFFEKFSFKISGLLIKAQLNNQKTKIEPFEANI